MRVTVRVFARLRDIVGAGEWTCELAGPATIGDVWQRLVAAHPALSAHTRSLSCARNEEYASMATAVADGDEVAFLPPVSGGSRSSSPVLGG